MDERQIIKEKLRRYICDVLLNNPTYPLRDDESMINDGLLDSFSVVDITVFLEEAFDLYVANEEIDVEQIDTLNLLADFVQSRQQAEAQDN